MLINRMGVLGQVLPAPAALDRMARRGRAPDPWYKSDLARMAVPFVIVMGVTGSGKTTLGRRIAHRLDVEFFDADDFHSRENIEKMARGEPLDDGDRGPWLGELASLVSRHPDGGVLACSALKQSYRDALDPESNVVWVHLVCTPALALERLAKRSDHFMPTSLVQSQFDALEEPVGSITIDSSKSSDEQVAILQKALRGRVPPSNT